MKILPEKYFSLRLRYIPSSPSPGLVDIDASLVVTCYSITMKGGGFGLAGTIVAGIIGLFVGGFLFKVLGLKAGGMIGSVVIALVGAIVLL